MKVIALIDCQNDFIDGALGVGYDKWAGAYDYIEKKMLGGVSCATNGGVASGADCIPKGVGRVPTGAGAGSEGVEIVFTQDFHPADHCSFGPQGGPWPAHCVQGTEGANFYWKLLPLLKLPNCKVLQKGCDSSREEYGINVLKESSGVTEVHIAGLCTDYCVKESAIMTAKENPAVTVYVHLSGSAYIAEDTMKAAVEEMKTVANIKVVR